MAATGNFDFSFSALNAQERCRLLFYVNQLFGPPNDSTPACPVEFRDGYCWPKTKPNTTLLLPCSNNSAKVLSHFCTEDAVWTETDASQCDKKSDNHLLAMYYIYWVGYVASSLLLALAVGTFLLHRYLWCLRTAIHANLALSFAFHNITWLVCSLFGVELQIAEKQTLCHISTLLINYFLTAGFFWMFIEGLYLFISVRCEPYKEKLSLGKCLLCGWVLPLMLILIRIVVQDWGNSCWEEKQGYLDYINLVPILCILFVNLFFLIFIMRVVISKLRTQHNFDWKLYCKSARALLILSLLLGVNYILILCHVSQPDWLALFYSYFTTVISSSQGGLIALLFCFRNFEEYQVEKRKRSLNYNNWNKSSDFSNKLSIRNEIEINIQMPEETVALNGGRSDYKNVILMNDRGLLRSADQEIGLFSCAPSRSNSYANLRIDMDNDTDRL